MTQPTTTTAGIRWRKLPTHSRFTGWVGIPYHQDGIDWDGLRYYVRKNDDGTFDTWCDVMTDSWSQFQVTDAEFATVAQAQAVCLSDWMEVSQ